MFSLPSYGSSGAPLFFGTLLDCVVKNTVVQDHNSSAGSTLFALLLLDLACVSASVLVSAAAREGINIAFDFT